MFECSGGFCDNTSEIRDLEKRISKIEKLLNILDEEELTCKKENKKHKEENKILYKELENKFEMVEEMMRSAKQHK